MLEFKIKFMDSGLNKVQMKDKELAYAKAIAQKIQQNLR